MSTNNKPAQPRTWWNVMWTGDHYPFVQAERQFKTREEAAEWAVHAIGPDSEVMEYEIIKVTEVLPTTTYITGWVAWHPEQRQYCATFTYEACWDELLGISMGDFQTSEDFYATRDAEKVAKEELGWRIRSVEMRFTDEGEG